MRKNFLIYPIIFSFFMLTFSSCVNHDFDLDDDKLDTNATFGDGINLPVGSIERISVYDELLKVYDQLEIGTDGVLYVKYDGSFPVEFPDFEDPTLNRMDKTANIDGLPGLVGSIPANLLPWTLVPEQHESYEMSVPEFAGENELSIEPKKVAFQSFALGTKIKLTGLNFPNPGEDAKLVLSVKFSNHYTIKGSDAENKITSSVLLKDLNGSEECLLDPIEVASYSFTEESESGLTYSVRLEGASPIAFTASDPKFTLILDPGTLSISYLESSVNGSKEFSGKETGFGGLQGAFSDDDILEFSNPSLSLNLTTNLGADFNLGLDLNGGSDDKHTALKDFLSFEKSEDGSMKTKPYLLTVEQLDNFDRIISTPFPEELDYAIKLSFNDPDAKLLPSDKLELSADYSFQIPFDFKKISLTLKDTITDLFTEDTYDQIFSHIDDVAIEADLVNSIGGGNIKVDISAVILDSDRQEIPDLVTSKFEDNKLSIAIKDNEDGAKMKRARHLALTFRLSGAGAIKQTDSIEIKKLRLVSSGGIHYEF